VAGPKFVQIEHRRRFVVDPQRQAICVREHRHRPAMTGDRDSLTLFDRVEKLRQLGLGLECADGLQCASRELEFLFPSFSITSPPARPRSAFSTSTPLSRPSTSRPPWLTPPIWRGSESFPSPPNSGGCLRDSGHDVHERGRTWRRCRCAYPGRLPRIHRPSSASMQSCDSHGPSRQVLRHRRRVQCALRVSERVSPPAPHRPHRADFPQRVPQVDSPC